jgi:spore germination protein KA
MKRFKNRYGRKDSIVNTCTAGCISKGLDENIEKIKKELGNPGDLVIKIFEPDNYDGFRYSNIYFETLVDKVSINSLSMDMTEILKPRNTPENSEPEEYFRIFRNYLLSYRKSEEGSDFDALFTNLLSGKTILLIDGYDRFISIDIFSTESRSVDEPTTQSVIRGPKEGFIENIDVNISLVRKRLKTKDLRVENLTLGSVTNTKISLMYIDKIARKDIVDEIRLRLNKIKIDAILDSGNIEELIRDDRYSIFPELLYSEKPDSVTANLLEGRVAIFVDGSSYVLTAPALFVEFLQVSEDYYHNFLVSLFIRILRYGAVFLTLFVPAGYISLITFHQEMIPTPLLISISSQRESVPFPALIEAILMEGVFEILREAGIRMPRVIGPAISIVGALVLGQAAVEAGIVSAFMVIIVSITAISSFAIPNYSLANALRIIRFVLMLLAGMYGLYGVFMGFMALILHLCKLKSMGIPYMIPIAPKTKYAAKDTIIRYPLWSNKTRPAGISGSNLPRVDADNIVTKKEKENPEFR